MNEHPYQCLNETAFWRNAVAERAPWGVEHLWTPKFPLLPQDGVVTAGSCFAQHIGRALVRNGHRWIDAEPAPKDTPAELAKRYNYGVFSFRTGNIYTPRMFQQWLAWAFEDEQPSEPAWERKGRFHDPFRPEIEPQGFASADEVTASRNGTLAAIRRAILTCDVVVFTLGLTESWHSRETGEEFANCPGVSAGKFDETRHRFHNHDHASTRAAMQRAIEIIAAHNPDARVLLTVSPVPLTATASGRHAIVATTHSKSVLRAVAGELADSMAHVDYFPSYEIITSPAFGGMFYQANRRNVAPQGVDFVMSQFFADQNRCFGEKVRQPSGEGDPAPGKATPDAQGPDADDLVCEEAMLEGFAHG